MYQHRGETRLSRPTIPPSAQVRLRNCFSYTSATSTDLVAVGPWLYNPNTASTATTGQHIGALTFQDIPALSSATINGPTQQVFSNPAEFTVGLNEPAGTGGVVVTTVQLEWLGHLPGHAGWGERHEQSRLQPDSQDGTFWLTPGGATGNRTISITTSPTLTYSGSPFTYDALPAATGYTVTGATGGHQLVPATWTVSLIGGDFAGTITATPGGGAGQCQIFSPTVGHVHRQRHALQTFTSLHLMSIPSRSRSPIPEV